MRGLEGGGQRHKVLGTRRGLGRGGYAPAAPPLGEGRDPAVPGARKRFLSVGLRGRCQLRFWGPRG